MPTIKPWTREPTPPIRKDRNLADISSPVVKIDNLSYQPGVARRLET
jgi:hypothetical protein